EDLRIPLSSLSGVDLGLRTFTIGSRPTHKQSGVHLFSEQDSSVMEHRSFSGAVRREFPGWTYTFHRKSTGWRRRSIEFGGAPATTNRIGRALCFTRRVDAGVIW